jgi:Major Facilitator Superfamily
MTARDNLVVTTALPVISQQLGGGIDTLEWTVNGYTLTFAVLLLTGAALADRFGRRRMFVAGIGIFALGSAAAALAPVDPAADRCARLPGSRGSDRHSAHPHHPHGRGPSREARRRVRRLERDPRPRGGDRPACRRRRYLGHQLAVDLLAQRPDRADRAPFARTKLTESYGPRRTSTCPASASPAPDYSGSCGRSCAAIAPAGSAPRSQAQPVSGSPR